MNKILKFIYLFTFSFILFFVCYDSPKADDDKCTKYQCITCKVVLGGNEKNEVYAQWDVVSDGKGFGEVTFSKSSIMFTSVEEVKKFVYPDFFDKEKNTLVCPTVYVNSYANGQRGYKYFVSVMADGDNYKKSDKVQLVKDNKKKAMEDGKSVAKTCTYSSNIRISVLDDSLNVTCKEGYECSVDDDIKASMFKDTCPNLYTTCVSNGALKICRVTTDSTGGFSVEDNPYNTSETDEISEWANNKKNDTYSSEETDKASGCELIKDDLQDFLHDLFFYISIGGVIIVVVMTIFDLFKVITGDVDDAMKKFLKGIKARLIVLVILLLLPAIISFIIGVVNNVAKIGGYNSGDPFCGVIDKNS